MATNIPEQFVPQAYATQYNGTAADRQRIADLLTSHGIPWSDYFFYEGGKVIIRVPRQANDLILSPDSWLVIFMSEVYVLSPPLYNLAKTGVLS